MKAQASPLRAICCGPMSLRPARPTAERDRQSCGGGAEIRRYERLPALVLDGCRPHIANILSVHEPVAIEINGLLHGEFARAGTDGSGS